MPPLKLLHLDVELVLRRPIETTPFYKGESQEKRLILRLEGAEMFAFSPAHVRLVGSGLFFLQIHL